MSERVDFSVLKPKIPELNTGALSMPDRDNVSKNPVNNSIFTEQIPQKNSKISLSQEKLLPDDPKLAEYGIDLNKPFEITPEMIKKMKSKGKKGFWESLKDGVKNAIPFVSGALEIKKSVDLIAIAKKQERGEKLTKEETEKMYLYLLEQVEAQHRGSSFWGKVGEGLTHMPAFAGEFFLTGGVYSLGKTAARKAITKLAGEITKEQVKKYIAKNVAEVAVGAAARSLVLSNTYANIAKRRLEIDTTKLKDGTGELSLKESKESLGESIGKGMLDGYIESVSEQSGAGFNYVLSKPLAKLPFGKFLVPTGKTKEFMAKTGFNGILEEFAEERFGGFLRGATKLENDENKSYLENVFWSTLPPTWEDAGVELMTTTLWGGGMSATHKGINNFVERKFQEAMADIENIAQLPCDDMRGDVADINYDEIKEVTVAPKVITTQVTQAEQNKQTLFELDLIFKKRFPKTFETIEKIENPLSRQEIKMFVKESFDFNRNTIWTSFLDYRINRYLKKNPIGKVRSAVDLLNEDGKFVPKSRAVKELLNKFDKKTRKEIISAVEKSILSNSTDNKLIEEIIFQEKISDVKKTLTSIVYNNSALRLHLEQQFKDSFAFDYYKNTYLKNTNLTQEVQEKCLQLAEKYGYIVFLNDFSNEKALQILEHIKNEIIYFDNITGYDSKAEMAFIVDVNNTNTYKGMKLKGLTKWDDGVPVISVSYDDMENFSAIFRHEFIHTLTPELKFKSFFEKFTKRGNRYQNTDKHDKYFHEFLLEAGISPEFIKSFPESKFISCKELMPKKGIFNRYIDIDNCKYIDELVKAGINPKLIQYAYSSPSEFFAIALSGNTAAYSEEFKSVLRGFNDTDIFWIEEMLNRPQPKPINYTQEEIAERVEFVKNDYKKKIEQHKNDEYVKSLRNLFDKTWLSENMAALSQDSTLSSIFYDINSQDILNKVKDGDKPVTLMKLESLINGYHIPLSEINKFRNKLMQEGFTPEDAFIKLIQTLDVYTLITNHPLFKLIPLTFNDVYTLKEDFQGNCYPKETIEDIIQEKIELTYDENFYDIEAEIVSEANMYLYVDLQRRLTNRTDCKFDKIQVFNDVQINGEPLSLVVNEHLSIGDNSDVKLETEELIKSNIVTLELINNSVIADAIIAKHQGECIEKAKINEKAFDYKINISNAINKLKSGEKLVSQEIHILTDALMQLYESDLKFKNEIDKTINQSDVQNKIAKIRSIVSAIRKQIPANKNVEITNHFILRMIDRNILTAYNIQDNKQYSLKELFELIMQTCNKAKPVGDSQVSLNDKDTQIAPKLEFLIKADNGKFVFDTILN